MATEYLIKQTIKIFTRIAINLINPGFRFPNGGAATHIVTQALERLEKKCGGLSRERIVDYCVTSAYIFKDRGTEWKINQVFGPKSTQRFDTDKGRRYYEDRWLTSANITRADLLSLIEDKSQHPQAKYIYLPMEESTKRRLLNHEAGFLICQSSTLGWSPESECCSECKFTEECKIETNRKFPEIYRLRLENGIK